MRRRAECVFFCRDRSNQHAGVYNPSDTSAFPDDCLVDFDMKLIDLFAEMDKTFKA